MNPSLDVLSDAELADTSGGNPIAGLALLASVWKVLVDKVEQNPDDYTFLMDWYYQSND
jgi:hypothetical protein